MINILRGKSIIKNSGNYSEIMKAMREMENRIKLSFSLVKEEFEEHLDSINENTNEVQFNYDYIYELDKKIDKLNQRLDDIELMLMNSGMNSNIHNHTYGNFPKFYDLPVNEREILLLLISSNSSMSYKEISHRLTVSDEAVKSSVISLISKGIPITKQYSLGKVSVGLDHNFKVLVSKENILDIDSDLNKSILI